MQRSFMRPAGRLTKWLTPLAAVFSLVALLAVVIVSLRQDADSMREVEVGLQQMRADANALSAVEWRAMATRGVDEDFRQDAESVAENLRASFLVLEPHRDEAVELATALDGARAFADAVADQLELLERGDLEAALEIDETRVDPSYKTFADAAALSTSGYEARVADRVRLTERLSVLALFIAAGVIALLLYRLARGGRVAAVAAAREQAQVESEQRMRALINGSADIFTTVDADGRVASVAGSVRRVFDGDAEKWIGSRLAELVHPDDADTVAELFVAVRSDRESSATRTFRVRRDDGSWAWAEAVASDCAEDSVIGATVVLLRDVTGRRQAEVALRGHEEALRHSQRLEAVGRLAGGIAHDFNNLLMVVQGRAEVLLTGEVRGSERHTGLREIHEMARRAAGLTHQLLAFSRQQVLRPAAVDLARVIESAGALLRPLVGEDVQLKIAAECDTYVLADQIQLEQVLVNLVVNARDAMPEGGALTIDVRLAELTGPDAASLSLEEGTYVRLMVADDGVGMDEETLSQIYDPFFTTKPLGEGTGLGLATVHGIVHQTGGSIAVASSPGSGTSFTIHLPHSAPAERSPAATPPAATPLPAAGQRLGTILLAEDEYAVRNLVESVLRRAGHEVLSAADGVSALELASACDGAIDLLVSDVRMPRMGGLELARQIRASHPSLPVILMTGYSAETDAGIDVVFLEKPYSVGRLLSTVRDQLGAPRTGVTVARDGTAKAERGPLATEVGGAGRTGPPPLGRSGHRAAGAEKH